MEAGHAEATDPAATVPVAQLLSRVSDQLERTAASISRVEASLCVLVGQVNEIPAHLIRDLQEIDLAHQCIFDISRVVQVAADALGPSEVSSLQVEQAIKVRELARHFLWPHLPEGDDRHEDHGGMSWL